MRVALFLQTGQWAKSNPRGVKKRSAFARGLLRHGITPEQHLQSDGYKECDVAVMWGCGKKRFPETMIRDDIVKAHGDKPFVRIERGYLRRDRYESIGLEGLWGHGTYFNEDSPPGRFKQLGLEIEEWKPRPAGHVVIIGQVPWDTSVQNHDFAKWVKRARWAAKKKGLPCVFREHPQLSRQPPLEDDVRGARCVVTLTSTTAMETLLMGVPTMATDPGSMAWNLCGSYGMSPLSYPPMPAGREQFFYDLAYTQWNQEEIARGEAWANLFL